MSYELVRAWKERGQIVGFTNGCFDLLHDGHLSHLYQCKAECDRLIVGLNGDGSVRKLKGEGRPVQSLPTRMDALVRLSCVDAVKPFDDISPYSLITKIRPDVLFKSGDYIESDIIGATFVKRYGGRVVITRYAEKHSTTSRIEHGR